MKKINNYKFHFIISVFALIAGCAKKVVTADVKSETFFYEKGYSVATVLIPEGMAGCSWLLHLENRNLEPLNLPDEFKKDSMLVWVKYHKEKNKVSPCMMGDIVTIDEIEEKK